MSRNLHYRGLELVMLEVATIVNAIREKVVIKFILENANHLTNVCVQVLFCLLTFLHLYTLG